MQNSENVIAELEERLRLLKHQQQRFSDELIFIQRELNKLRSGAVPGDKSKPISKPSIEVAFEQPAVPVKPSIQIKHSFPSKNVEDFIGTNLISKVGILITIIGIFIGAKYAIDKELISPFMRIILGYLAGASLIFTAVKLKAKYLNFSAVLMGGGLAVIYFITYTSYSFYQLVPQAMAFGLMVLITISAVAISLWYNQKIIAILGQVAAYALPFLLSDGSGKTFILFAYVSIINVGLIYLSFKKDWKILYHLAFFLTWLIATTVVINVRSTPANFVTTLLFLSINFLIFYITFLSYKIVRRELYNVREVGVSICNAIVFFFLGIYIVNDAFYADSYLSTFTLSNALVHFVAAFIIYRLKLADDTVYQFLVGLGLLFITIAIPIELDGNWVTLLWMGEAAILTYIAVKNNRDLYLKIAIAMISIGIVSLLHDWSSVYPLFGGLPEKGMALAPIFNNTFIISLIACGSLGFIYFKTYSLQPGNRMVLSFFKTSLPLMFWIVLYFTFFNEIHYTWHLKIDEAANRLQPANFYQTLSLFIYTMVFFAVVLFFNGKSIKAKSIDDALLVLGIFVMIFFFTGGLLAIGALRDFYIAEGRSANPSMWLLAIRYVCFMAIAIFLFAEWQAVKRTGSSNSIKLFSILFSIVLLTIICNEFVHWMDLAGYKNEYKLGLTIICGLYALVLIFAGIVKKQKHFRIAAIVLFTITLLKLFFYDLSTLSTISKTIVLVILGGILLVVSFLYNKYKAVILGDE